ncbi:MAG: nitroreductase [Clostridia bacterium]|nr:nitroreductase [Clostridia bacterium]
MNEVLNNLKTRRSIRKFKPDMLPKADLEQIVEAGLYAASGRGKQAVVTIAVTDKALRDRIAADNCRIGGWPESFDPFYGAPAILIVLADKSCPTGIYDGSLVMGNLMQAAHALGLGSIWIHRAKEEFETDFYRKLLADLGVEGEWEGIGHCALGYADGDAPAAAPRKDGRVFWIEG